MPITITSMCLRGNGLRVSQNNRRMCAFTLVELLVVVLILGVLACVAIPRIGQSVDDAKKRACETNIDIFNQAIERYYLANGVFPIAQHVVKRDKNIFPGGPPLCPVTERVYRGMTATKRVDTSEHNH
jgi:prepilin-type N-terminal cleavage/methylation domain-containing protein